MIDWGKSTTRIASSSGDGQNRKLRTGLKIWVDQCVSTYISKYFPCYVSLRYDLPCTAPYCLRPGSPWSTQLDEWYRLVLVLALVLAEMRSIDRSEILSDFVGRVFLAQRECSYIKLISWSRTGLPMHSSMIDIILYDIRTCVTLHMLYQV